MIGIQKLDSSAEIFSPVKYSGLIHFELMHFGQTFTTEYVCSVYQVVTLVKSILCVNTEYMENV